MKSLREQLVEFHQAVSQPVVLRPAVPADDRVRLRAALIMEEAFECLAAMLYIDEATAEGREAVMRLIADGFVHVNLPALVDGLADLDYVVEGTRLELGVDGVPVAAEVHRANMTKATGAVAPNGKQMKPPGFRPPDIAGELEKQGWKP